MATSDEIPAGSASSLDDIVPLEPDHPGFNDLDYRHRRNEIAKIALEYRLGDPVPTCHYTGEEHAVWREVWANLDPLHQRLACRQYLDIVDVVGLDRERIPQLQEVNEIIEPHAGFRMIPVAGLVKARKFLGSLENRVFLSTQYIRHPSVPLYTPEPDIVHELVGHASTFAHPQFARMNRAFGAAARRAPDDATVEALGLLYWYSIEFGAVREGGEVKAYGAGLLSSFGELSRFVEEAKLAPFDPDVMSRTPYDPTQYQETIFVADDFDTMVDELEAWLAKVG